MAVFLSPPNASACSPSSLSNQQRATLPCPALFTCLSILNFHISCNSCIYTRALPSTTRGIKCELDKTWRQLLISGWSPIAVETLLLHFAILCRECAYGYRYMCLGVCIMSEDTCVCLRVHGVAVERFALRDFHVLRGRVHIFCGHVRMCMHVRNLYLQNHFLELPASL